MWLKRTNTFCRATSIPISGIRKNQKQFVPIVKENPLHEGNCCQLKRIKRIQGWQGWSDVETRIAENENNSKCSKRKKQLTPFELSEIIVEKGIKSRTELLAFQICRKWNSGCCGILQTASEMLKINWTNRKRHVLKYLKRLYKKNALLVVMDNDIPPCLINKTNQGL